MAWLGVREAPKADAKQNECHASLLDVTESQVVQSASATTAISCIDVVGDRRCRTESVFEDEQVFANSHTRYVLRGT